MYIMEGKGLDKQFDSMPFLRSLLTYIEEYILWQVEIPSEE